MGNLLKAIYNMLEIREESVQLSKHDLMYQGSSVQKSRVFPVHKSLAGSIGLKWENPERRSFFSGSLKCRFPFEYDTAHPWNRIPKLDAPLARVCASAISLKPALLATCVARNLEYWVMQLQSYISADTSRQHLLKSFPLLFKAVGFLSDASASARKSFKLAARSAVLVNSARRAKLLKV